ncbi:helix-turn-helix domain-containing protein [Nonomuraea phyllanthi]|uniref:helix-turn-helix domain-containing protein n=1 Tax=Nonomuraea phyllanthi TaxID=2219224 RepID=UPI0018855DE3|nr:helix-turn-helix transcriptional regulator [Nonomuraea phyllanthi]
MHTGEARQVAQGQSASAATVRLLVLGKRLRDLRQAAGKSLEDAAASLGLSPLAIRRIEQGQVKWKLPYIQILLQEYGVQGEEAQTFLTLTKEANQPGWWYRYRDALPEWFRAFVSLEEEASLIRAYEPHYVPGLLQTEEYARAVLSAGLDDEEEIGRRVSLRMQRQQLLTRPGGPDLWVVIDETVLRRPMVPPEVMCSQIDHLIEALALPNLKLQMIPFALCVHEGMYGPFHLFRFPFPEMPDIVYVENALGAVYLDQYPDVTAFQEALDRMSAQAPPPQRSKKFLSDIRKEIGA